ncbi:hypothetical protein [Geofilum rubicundum]|uniref:Porin n=1 Tax=Geofilum rubicundum JCM 15548 TaxID=1236989 RepID=A0A0E9LT56_9BACT|nr:hypothetical protein [Geofilum rubicundum]GAO28468.1 hypothetical protein JCM15548_1565 [Geofilum rubicundum JCM 15548]
MKSNFLLIVLLLLGCTLRAQVEEQPAGKISGTFFVDYYYNALRDDNFGALSNTALDGEEGVNGLQIRRIYLSYDYRFNSSLKTRLRLESDESNFTTNMGGDKANKFTMFIKDAYLDWGYADGHNLIVGIQPTPAFSASESNWGNRYIEKTIMDLRKVVPSRDLALSLKGKIDGDGMFKYWFMYGNNGAGSPEQDKYKRYFAHLEVLPLANFNFTIYGDYQSRASIDNTFVADETLSNNILTSAVYAGYKMKDKFSAGAEVFFRTVQNGYQMGDDYTDSKGFGLSVFGTYHFTQKINAFGRFDHFEPNSHADATNDKRQLIIGGLAYRPNSKLSISPNFLVETYEGSDADEVDSSVTARLTASWSF